MVDRLVASVGSAICAIDPVDQSGESVSAAPVGAVYRVQCQAPSNRLCDANCTGAAVTMLQLARRLGGGAPHDIDSLASSGMETRKVAAVIEHATLIDGWPLICIPGPSARYRNTN